MGDRTNCTLIVFGKTTEAEFERIVELCEDEEFEEPNVWQFSEVNYAQLDPDLKAAIIRAGLSFIWLHENGDDYQAGVELYDATGAFAEYQRCDMDLMISLRDNLNEARWWQAFLEQGMTAEVEFTREWEERAEPYTPEPPGPDAKRWYVTMTWDNWPEGGSYGAVVTADDADHAERTVFWQMANCREEFDHPADAFDSYAHEWHVVDCFLLEDFIAHNT